MSSINTVSIKDRLKTLRENYYLQSLTEQDPEFAGMQMQQPQMIPGADMANASGGLPPVDPAAAGPGMIPNQMSAGDPNMMGQDPTMGMGGDMSGMSGMMPGTPGYEPIKTAKELGRIYELNKIYTRLYVIHKILSSVSDTKLQNIRDMTSEVFEIYRLVLNNIKSYMGIIDDVILLYYQYLNELIRILDIYFKANSEKKEDVKSNNRESRLSDSGEGEEVHWGQSDLRSLSSRV